MKIMLIRYLHTGWEFGVDQGSLAMVRGRKNNRQINNERQSGEYDTDHLVVIIVVIDGGRWSIGDN